MPRHAFLILFCVQLAVAVGNTGLLSVLPAIGRTLGIADFLVSAIFALSALMWTITSPIWARASDRLGRKPLILVGLAGFSLSMTLSGAVVLAGLSGWLGAGATFGLFLLARAIFGLLGSASNPAAQAYIAERTTRAERTQSMATLAGAFGMGTLGGPVIAPLFVLPHVGLAGPLFGFAALAAVMLVVVWRALPETRVERPADSATPLARPAPLWKDPRVAPFLVYGFLVATCQNAQSQTLGFLVIDKQQLSPVAAQGYIMIAMAGGAIAGLLAQWGLIRTFHMTPKDLLRWGVVLAAGGNLIVAFAPDYAAVVVGFSISSLGYGFARPGFTAGASLAVDLKDQARAAGAIAAINGANVLLAPAFVWFYEQWSPGPFLLNMAILLALLAYAFADRQLRSVNDRAGLDEAATASVLERGDEGAGP
jgi:MFS family permease